MNDTRVCPLCQFSFDSRKACGGCGVVKGCMLIRCPKCGYEFAEESKIVEGIKTIINRFRRKEDIREREACRPEHPAVLTDAIPLTEACSSNFYRIVFIPPKNKARLNRLAVLGILPGSNIRIHQKKPTYVIRIGETDVALDEEVVREIYVRGSGR